LINPGALSQPHTGTNFLGQFRLHFPQALAEAGSAANDAACGACHSAAHLSPEHWVEAAFKADPNPVQIWKLGSVKGVDMSHLDRSCLVCHEQHLFHQTNVVSDRSCSACHREHQGPGRMAAPTSAQCASCHGDSAVMAAAAAKGKTLPVSSFAYQTALGRVHLLAGRPPAGYTGVIHSFADDHPEFQLKRERLKDPDTLKFNHQRHFANDIPPLKGKPLACQTCHQLDASGTYFVKMSYETQCKPCHGLQFEMLTLPHGNPAAVRAFLNSLGRQYEDYALLQSSGLTGRREREAFVTNQLYRIQSLRLSGRDFEKEVFFGGKNAAPAPSVSNLKGDARPFSYGCAYCHEVTSAGSDVPVVTKPFIAERWLPHGSFNHLKHAAVACERCHAAAQSRETFDILLPSKVTCAECHSRPGGVADDCSVCHRYHNGNMR
jgi:hypothetical protein